MPELGAGHEIEPGVMFHEVSLPRNGDRTTVWIYLPKGADAEKHLRCILIAPAGTACIHGIKLGEGDRPEHLPYARAGFAVVAYELSGSIEDRNDNAAAIRAFKIFSAAGAGVSDAMAAIDFALAKVPQIDPQRIYAVGHSSAGSVALLVAEQEPYIKACVAFAPRTFLAESLGDAAIQQVSESLPNFRAMVIEESPSTRLQMLQCPLLLVHAEDDNVVPIQESARFVDQLSKFNKHVTFVRVPSGGHFQTMIDVGIPRAITWLKSL
jgi:dipeptidyl aminopeptidase/acylaminoacyl peptidase